MEPKPTAAPDPRPDSRPEMLEPGGRRMGNHWQGEFPWQNLLADGYEGIALVGSFPQNGYGVHEMTGNVWEWTTDWLQEPARVG